MSTNVPASPTLPRVAITYCTQCKWLLRAAYFAQELLSTFGTSIGEVALIPATGGIFTVYLTYVPVVPETEGAEGAKEGEGVNAQEGAKVQEVLLWDRKAEGGFPETKILKQRLRNCIEPGRGLAVEIQVNGRESNDLANIKETGEKIKERRTLTQHLADWTAEQAARSTSALHHHGRISW